MTTLVIGVGNTLRGDDGIGYRAAETLAARSLSGVIAVSSHQLLPELADDVRHAARVIFVDADVRLEPGVLSWSNIATEPSPTVAGHTLTATELLSLTSLLYDAQPPALLLSVGVWSMDHSAELTSDAEALLPYVVDEIVRVTHDNLSPPSKAPAPTDGP